MLLCLLAAGGAPGGGDDGPTGRFVVRVEPASMDAVAARATALGGSVERRLDGLEVAVVDMTAAAADALRRAPGVLGLTRDAPVRLTGATTGYDPRSDAGSMYSISQATGAQRVWGNNVTGKGVDVALVDSGVTPVPGLTGSGKILNGPDLSFESQNPATRHLDTFGHGTHMAGIIAAANEDTTHTGMAPGARLVSLKVADAHGNTDVTQVIAAIDWVVQHRNDPGMNIRVLNLSFGTPSMQDYRYDPLSYAAEVAWRKGIVVVVSAGNDGTGTGRLLNPAQDPHVLAVGAEGDSKGTPSIQDDTIPAFSTRGDGVRNPDVVAPGVSVQGLRVPGSYIDSQYGATAAFEDRFFRGSGTSQSAAVVSGAVALMLEQRPWLSPDQVKALLKDTAKVLPAADVQAQGRGLIDVASATTAPAPVLATQTAAPSVGTGTLDGARGAAKLVLDGVTLQGQRDIFGKSYVAATRTVQEMAGSSWAGGTWNGSSWAGSSWAGSSWAGATWAGATWAGSSWAGSSWASGVWNGSSWAGATWAGSSWAGATWAGSSWAGSSWAGGVWASGRWG